MDSTNPSIDARLRRIELLMVDMVASTEGLGPGAPLSPTGARTRAKQTALQILNEHREPMLETREAA